MKICRVRKILFVQLTILAALCGVSLVSAKTAPKLPAPGGNVVRVSDVASLQAAVENLTPGTTVMIAPGEYRLEHTLLVDSVDNISLRGESGNRDDVVIRAKGMLEKNFGDCPQVIRVRKSKWVTVADITVADAWNHNIQIMGETGTTHFHLYNTRLLDSGEQFLKASFNPKSQLAADSGLVEYCSFEYTDRSRDWYSNGVDVLFATGWIVRDNDFIRIRGPLDELCGPAILFFGASSNATIERNFFYNCDVAIGAGIFSHETPYAHRDCIIRNNIVFRDEPGGASGILVGFTKNFKIYNNTVFLGSSTSPRILYGDNLSNGEIINNLCDGPLQAADDSLTFDPWSPSLKGKPLTYKSFGGDNVELKNNLITAEASWFVDAMKGNLHLVAGAAAIDKAVRLDPVRDDFDSRPREADDAPDVGADEFDKP